MQHNRRIFLGRAAAFGVSLGLSPFSHSMFAAPFNRPAGPMDAAVVEEFVRVAHSDFDCLKAIVDAHPLVLNAAWDWGDGDFETALGAAGHMGLRETALYLLEKGARADIFALTMLGETAIVKPMLERFPELLSSIGPHGFTLLHHAKKGGDQALDLLDFLTEKGLTETFIDVFQKKKR